MLVCIKGFSLLLLGHCLLCLGKGAVLAGLFLDILLSNFDECIFETVQLNIKLHLRDILFNLPHELADSVNIANWHKEQRVLVSRVLRFLDTFKAFTI